MVRELHFYLDLVRGVRLVKGKGTSTYGGPRKVEVRHF
jgi:hypothetical protein